MNQKEEEIKVVIKNGPVVIDNLKILKSNPLIIAEKVDFLINTVEIEEGAVFEIDADAKLRIINLTTYGKIVIRNGATVIIDADDIEGNVNITLTDTVKTSVLIVEYGALDGNWQVNSLNKNNSITFTHK